MTPPGTLGRREPTDWRHVEKYPLRALAAEERPTLVPVVIGVNWYQAFDASGLIMRSTARRFGPWVRDDGNLGSIRGGHALVLEPFGDLTLRDRKLWWRWYDQVSEGICVGEAVCRAMNLLNRRRYQPRALYDAAQLVDEWSGEEPTYSGTSVRAGLDVARVQGLAPAKPKELHKTAKHSVETSRLDPFHGISANRWALNDDEVFAALGRPDGEYAVWLNSWGASYPHRVHVPRSVIARLMAEHGEFGIVVDR